MKLFLFSFIAILLTSCINKQGTAKFDVADGVFNFDELDDANVIDGNAISFDINTLANKDTVRGEAITYACTYDNVIDQTVSSSASDCSTLSITFDSATGEFDWTPTLAQAGTYEFKIVATVSGNSKTMYFSSIITPSVDLAPSVTSINRQTGQTNPTNNTSVVYTVIFSESVSNVTTADFTLTTTGTATGTISGIAGTGTTYQVTVNTISGNGDLRLDLNDANSSIVDSTNNTLVPNTQNGNQVFSIINPVEPTDLLAKVKNQSTIELSWTGNVSYYDTYTIAYQTGTTAPISCNVGTIIPYTSITGTSHRITGLTLGQTYSFRVCATYTDGTFETSGLAYNNKKINLSDLTMDAATIIRHGDYLYTSGYAGSDIHIYDVSADNIGDRANIIRFNGIIAYQAFIIEGNYLYIIPTDSTAEDLYIYDISNPLSVSLASSTDLFPFGENIEDIVVNGNYAYIGTPDNLYIINISTPSAPVLTGTYTSGAFYSFRDLVYDPIQDVIYSSHGNSLTTTDVSIKTAPNVVADTTMVSCGNISRMRLLATTLYLQCWQPPYGIDVIDISNPLLPSEDHFHPLPDEPLFDLILYNGYLYANVNGADYYIISTADYSETTIPATVFGFTFNVNNDRLYTNVDSTLKIYDITTATAPNLLSTKEVSAQPAIGLYYHNDLLAVSSATKIELVDISDVSVPVKMSEISTTMGSAPHNVFMKGDYLYLPTSGALDVYDISDPTTPTHLPGSSIASTAASHSAHVTNLASGATDWLITANNDNTFTVYDISAAPTVTEVTTVATGYVPASYNAMKVMASGEYFYALAPTSILVYHMSDPNNPVTTINIVNANPSYTRVANFDIEGNYLYVVDNANGIHLIDITTPATPATIGTVLDATIALPYSINKINSIGDRLILTSFFGMMEIFDISTPGTISSLGVSTNRFGYSYGFHTVDLEDDEIGYFNDLYGSTHIIDASDPADITLSTTQK